MTGLLNDKNENILVYSYRNLIKILLETQCHFHVSPCILFKNLLLGYKMQEKSEVFRLTFRKKRHFCPITTSKFYLVAVEYCDF